MNSGRRPLCNRVVAMVMLMALAACAAFPPPPSAIPEPEVRAALGRVAVIAGSDVLQVDTDFVDSKVAVASSRGADALLTCLGEAAIRGCHGPMCGPMMVVILGVCGVFGTVVAISDSTPAAGAALIAGSEQAFNSAVDAQAIQRGLQTAVADAAKGAGTPLVEVDRNLTQVAAAAKDYQVLAARGVDTVVETTLRRISTSARDYGGFVVLRIEARARLVRAHDNRELFSNDYLFVSEARTLGEWAARDGAALLAALTRAHADLSEQMVENTVMLHPFPYRAARGIGFLTASFGLAPEFPATRFNMVSGGGIGEAFEWVSVDSVQPVLRWESFPRTEDRAAAPAAMGRVANVAYDLVVAREENYRPGAMVYRRTAITDNSHRLGEPLQPGAKYFWSVRARFELDGRKHVTEWASLHHGARSAVSVPNVHSYRFSVPE